jgi:adenine deaminase
MVGSDKSVRILSTKTRTELAKLAHNMQVTAVAWMDRDAGIITLGENGIVSTWTRSVGSIHESCVLHDTHTVCHIGREQMAMG